jgi:hypothetical protein
MGPETTDGRRAGNPFTKDTVRGILQNRFYLGELPDGKGGWIAGKHPAAVDADLFAAVLEERERRRTAPPSIRRDARVFSLSTLLRCRVCGGRMRVSETWKGRVRFYCRSKAQGLGCNATGTYLDVYEMQLLSYLGKFNLPEDYQSRILATARMARSEANDEARERRELTVRLERTKRLFQWGDIDQAEYRSIKEEITRRLRALTPEPEERERLAKLQRYLADLPQALEDATQEQRNRLLKTLLETVWVHQCNGRGHPTTTRVSATVCCLT